MLKATESEQQDFQFFCAALKELAGIHMRAGKNEMVRTRLRPRLTLHGLSSFSEYRSLLESLPEAHPEWEVFVNLLTTNKTDFFREPKHFEFLAEKIIPDWLKEGEKTFKVWSAASSTGEEAYTLAMVLENSLPKNVDYKILATDVDSQVIRTVQNAVYPISRKPEIPPELHSSSIDLGRGECEGFFRIKRVLKQKVTGKCHNLIEASSPGEGVFDVIFCRNVFIYFDKPTIEFVAQKLMHATKPGGYMFIGHSESLQNIRHNWLPAGPSIFRKKLR